VERVTGTRKGATAINTQRRGKSLVYGVSVGESAAWLLLLLGGAIFIKIIKLITDLRAED